MIPSMISSPVVPPVVTVEPAEVLPRTSVVSNEPAIAERIHALSAWLARA